MHLAHHLVSNEAAIQLVTTNPCYNQPRSPLHCSSSSSMFYFPNRSTWSVYSLFLEGGRTEKHSLSRCPPLKSHMHLGVSFLRPGFRRFVQMLNKTKKTLLTLCEVDHAPVAFGFPSQEVSNHDDVKWKHFPRYWPFVRVIHRSPVNSPHKGQWREALMFSLICAWLNGRVNNREAGDLRRHLAHYDAIVMYETHFYPMNLQYLDLSKPIIAFQCIPRIMYTVHTVYVCGGLLPVNIRTPISVLFWCPTTKMSKTCFLIQPPELENRTVEYEYIGPCL